MDTNTALENLLRAIAAAEEAVRQLRIAQTTPEGWCTVGPNGIPPSEGNAERFAKRHGCLWNAKENVDLTRAFSIDLQSVEKIALRHRRTESGIRSQLHRLASATEFHAYLNRLATADTTQ